MHCHMHMHAHLQTHAHMTGSCTRITSSTCTCTCFNMQAHAHMTCFHLQACHVPHARAHDYCRASKGPPCNTCQQLALEVPCAQRPWQGAPGGNPNALEDHRIGRARQALAWQFGLYYQRQQRDCQADMHCSTAPAQATCVSSMLLLATPTLYWWCRMAVWCRLWQLPWEQNECKTLRHQGFASYL